MIVDGIHLTDHTNDMVAKSIISGSWEPASRELWKKYVSELPFRAVVWDIGAYTGIYSLIAAKQRPDIYVTAFEPHPTIYSTLLDNINANQLHQISAENFAVADENKTCRLNITNNIKMPSGSSLIDIGKPIQTTIEINAVTGDEYSRNSLEIPSLIKIDVEGFEIEVLSGMKGLLENHKPIMLIEILSEDVLSKIIDFLSVYGYTIHRINENGGSFDPPFSLTDRNYLCLPN